MYHTYQVVCIAKSLLGNNKKWIKTLKEYTLWAISA